MEKHFALFKNFLLFQEQEKISLAKYTFLLVSNLDLSIARFIDYSDSSNVLLIWLIRNLLQAQDEEIQNIKLSFSSSDLWPNIKSPKLDTNNINNTSISNLNSRSNNVLSPLGIFLKKGKDPPNLCKQIDDDIIFVTSSSKSIKLNVNNNNNITRPVRSRDSGPNNTVSPVLTPTEDHVLTLMQDIKILELINISSNIHKDSDPSPTVTSISPSISPVLMDTSSSNNSLIKKANNKKKKKSKQDSELVVPSEVVLPHVPIDMLVDVLEPATASIVTILTKENDIVLLISIPQEILDITFNEIVNESINMIVDQLDSTHLSSILSNPLTDQLSTRYLALLSSTDILDKSHSFTPS
ncbi:hypothetical protein C1645_838145 [Glomus cerebriforme]|uniref:Uncharacterized protein n=1 Tax=Glomus cerebriforme TaxID=658196 RepID=A0A397S426_9GLOM|nr:hypothetical protein C1645_838145 [Glomus cerebriforme]